MEKVKKMLGNVIFRYSFLTLQLIYMEIVIRLFNYKLAPVGIFYRIVFSVLFGYMFSALFGLFKGTVNKILTFIFSIFYSLYFVVQLVYFYVFKVYFSFYSIGAVGTDILDFITEAAHATLVNIPGIILLCLPPVLYGFIKKYMDFNRVKLYPLIATVAGVPLCWGLFYLILLAGGREAFSAYDLYVKDWVDELGAEKLGVLAVMQKDFTRSLGVERNSSDDIVIVEKKPSPTPTTAVTMTPTPSESLSITQSATPTPSPSPTPTPYLPNVLEIDFTELAANEENDVIKKLHEYFDNEEPTYQNEYTGMFEGYNYIQITAEGFSQYAVSEELTPTLYKMMNTGFVFNNFYTALWETSTSDGEYVSCTGLIPVGTHSMKRSSENALPFCLGNQLRALGYKTTAYHDHTYTYYSRDKSHPNMGYDYYGYGNGLNVKYVWPESDYEMMQLSVPEYIESEPFHTYYMTVSGHLQYSFNTNAMSIRNRKLVENLPYTEMGKAYISCNIELEKAVKYLVEQLEEAGIADRTLIAISSDHYPYGLNKEARDDLAGHEVEMNFEVFENVFILWSASMEEPVIVDKYCSSLDILPTVSNLLGVKYDSRLLMGRDIFSTAEPLVILANRSFITDKVMYNSKTGEVIKLTDEELPDGYVDEIIQIVKNKFTVSDQILKNDYYSYLPDFY